MEVTNISKSRRKKKKGSIESSQTSSIPLFEELYYWYRQNLFTKEHPLATIYIKNNWNLDLHFGTYFYSCSEIILIQQRLGIRSNKQKIVLVEYNNGLL